ncbi:MAG: hypothetical protein KKA67_00310 [Spirochaetes bacterium]|nr:hypothetical protein [Spirochaetota bacterium]MBU1079936.1 hypothetical protein [Spirochaetota bacterium]
MNIFDSLSQEIQDHLKQITQSSGLPMTDDSYERMAAAWIEKKGLFEKSLEANRLVEVGFFGRSEERGALALTWSGSIINVGPLVDGKRRCEYTSIGLRTDVPPSAAEDSSDLSADIEADEPVQFAKGPIRTSSPVYKIAVSAGDMDPEEERAMLTQVSQVLAEDFAEVNKTVIG